MPISSPKQPFFVIFVTTFLVLGPGPIVARNAHVINFRSPNLYPESLAWDPRAQHFLLGSLRQRIIAAVSDAGVVETFLSDTDLPESASFLGLAVDSPRNRLLAVVHSHHSLPHFNALAAYDLLSRRRLFLSSLPSDDYDAANDVAVDHRGYAFVTNSAGNFIWKVTAEGSASIFSLSPMYTAAIENPAYGDTRTPHERLGLNGITYVSKGYLLVVQSSSGKVFKVDAEDGTARKVLLNEDLIGADDIAVRGDGVAAAVSPMKMWLMKSTDSWAEAVVYDKLEVDVRRFPTSVVVGAKDRVYVLYGHLDEGRKGDSEREKFGIAEMRSKREGDENVWIFVLIGVGLAYFFFWRFQMSELVKKVDHKIH